MKSNKENTSQRKWNKKNESKSSKGRWLSYAAATGAAALTAGQADAVTLQFPGSGSVGPDGSVALDLNGDTTTDVTIFNLYSTSFYGTGSAGRAGASGSVLGYYGGYFSTGKSYLYAKKFSNFSSITPSFSGPGNPGYYTSGINSGTQHYMRDGNGFPLSGWGGSYNGPGLLGVRFDIGGNSHMGFVEISVDSSNNTNGAPGNIPTIISFGYETQPNTALSNPVPEPTSLGLLAMGAAGLATLRRRRKA